LAPVASTVRGLDVVGASDRLVREAGDQSVEHLALARAQRGDAGADLIGGVDFARRADERGLDDADLDVRHRTAFRRNRRRPELHRFDCERHVAWPV